MPKKTHRAREPLDYLSKDGFFVFTCLNTEKEDRGTKASSVNNTQLSEDLKLIDHFLSSKNTWNERVAYKECPRVPRATVYAFIEREIKAMEESTAESTGDDQKVYERKQKFLEQRVDILNASESIFQFFMPPLYDGPTVSAFWGAALQILIVRTCHHSPSYMFLIIMLTRYPTG